jgi:hypothetical protein
VNLTERDLQIAVRCVSELLDNRRLAGKPVPGWLVDHHRRVAAAYHRAVSTLGHETDAGTAESEHEYVTARQAAPIVGLSRRQVQRIGAADLDGRIVDGRWQYPLHAVLEYAEGKQH